jgi:hypothetical protein
MKGGLGPLIAGDGKQTRDFTYVEDIVQANLLAANAPRVSGKVFNIASGRAATLLDLADVLNTVLRANFAPIHVAPQDGEPRHLQANIERAQTELGFCPCTDLARDAHRCFGDTDTPLPARAAVAASAVPASLPDFRPDGPMRSILNPPHHRRDRTYRRL